MFDIGFWELCLIAIVALLIVGPQRLPKVAYELGLWFGRLQRFVRRARMDIERELHQYEIKQTLEKHKKEFGEIKRLAEDSGKELHDGLKSFEHRADKSGAADSTKETTNAGTSDNTAENARDRTRPAKSDADE